MSICGTTDTLVADTSCMAVVFDYANSVNAIDNCGTPIVSLTSPTPGSMITTGTTVAQLMAMDATGNFDTCSFNLLVVDRTDPMIVCPADQTVFLDMSGTATLGSYSPASATDNCGVPTISQSPLSGTTIMTDTTVTLIASDPSGNTDSCTFTVMVDTMTINIHPELNPLRVQAYPNPTKGLITVEVENATARSFVTEVFDIHGKLYARKESQSNTFQMNLQGLAQGVYFLKIRNRNGLEAWEKVVLE